MSGSERETPAPERLLVPAAFGEEEEPGVPETLASGEELEWPPPYRGRPSFTTMLLRALSAWGV